MKIEIDTEKLSQGDVIFLLELILKKCKVGVIIDNGHLWMGSDVKIEDSDVTNDGEISITLWSSFDAASGE